MDRRADLTHFDIEDLMQIKVVSATKVEQAVEDTASAVFVITPGRYSPQWGD
ncbi:MAG: hypothetical protein R3F36_03985 [Candidatus Competibacteraceae bacterium]